MSRRVFAHILDFRHSQQFSPSPGDSRPPAITTPHPRKAWLTAVPFIIDLSPFDIVTCTRTTCAQLCLIFDFGPQVRLSPTLSPFQNVADSLCIIHHPSFCPCRPRRLGRKGGVVPLGYPLSTSYLFPSTSHLLVNIKSKTTIPRHFTLRTAVSPVLGKHSSLPRDDRIGIRICHVRARCATQSRYRITCG